jgi:hypothetical protein
MCLSDANIDAKPTTFPLLPVSEPRDGRPNFCPPAGIVLPVVYLLSFPVARHCRFKPTARSHPAKGIGEVRPLVHSLTVVHDFQRILFRSIDHGNHMQIRHALLNIGKKQSKFAKRANKISFDRTCVVSIVSKVGYQLYHWYCSLWLHPLHSKCVKREK